MIPSPAEHRSLPPPRSLAAAIATTANNFHLVRLLAAAGVIYFHAFAIANPDARGRDLVTALVEPLTDTGGLAVATFFWVSGLFVTQSWQRSRAWWDFAIRRASRIWPALVACLVVTATFACLLSPAIGWSRWWGMPGYWEYIARNARFDLVFAIPDAFAGHPNTAINGSIHTLVLEVKLYGILLALGLLGTLLSRRAIAGTAAAALLLCAWQPGLLPHLLAAPSYGQVPIALFFAGMACCAAASWITPHVTLGTLAAGVALAAAPAPLGPIGAWTAIVALVAGTGAFTRAPPWLRPDADLSYGVFLYGFPVQQCLRALVPNASSGVLALGGLTGAAACAWVSWHALEAPAIGRGKALVHLLTARGERPAGFAAGLRRSAGILLGCAAVTLLAAGMQRVATQMDLWPVAPLGSRIVEYDPHTTVPGRGFNRQDDGSSAMWFRVDQAPPADTRVRMGGELLDAIVDPTGVVTCTVPDRMFARPRTLPIMLEWRAAGVIHRSAPVTLTIAAPPD